MKAGIFPTALGDKVFAITFLGEPERQLINLLSLLS